jgi:hypothetical protein
MRRIKIREDLINKSEFSKLYNINRVKIDKLIENGELSVERISGTDYIIIKKGLILKEQ